MIVITCLLFSFLYSKKILYLPYPKTATGSLVENTKALSEKLLRNSAKPLHKFDDKEDQYDSDFFFTNLLNILRVTKSEAPTVY